MPLRNLDTNPVPRSHNFDIFDGEGGSEPADLFDGDRAVDTSDLFADKTTEATQPPEVAEPEVDAPTEGVGAPIEVVNAPTQTPEPAESATEVTDPLRPEDDAAFDALFDRLFDDQCTEINIISNDPGAPTPYSVLVNINTVYYAEETINVTSEASLRRILRNIILPAASIDVPASKPLPPTLDGTLYLEDDSQGVIDQVRARFQVLNPPATYRTELHIAKLPKNDVDLEAMIANGTMPIDVAYFLGRGSAAGLNIVFSGIPNTGKTTLLNACSQEVPEGDKVAVIQDVDELPLPHLSAKQKLFTHRAAAKAYDGLNDGSASALIEVVKRTRPTRLFTGECRGQEMYDHLEASSIFKGCMTTVHASDAEQALTNIVNLANKHPMSPSIEGVRSLVASGVHLIVQLGIVNGKRVVTQVLELDGHMTDKGTIRRNLLWAYDHDTNDWVKGNTGPCERTQRILASAEEADYWHNTPTL